MVGPDALRWDMEPERTGGASYFARGVVGVHLSLLMFESAPSLNLSVQRSFHGKQHSEEFLP